MKGVKGMEKPQGYCIVVDTMGGVNPRVHHYYAPSAMEKEEWLHVIRKHAVNTMIENGYEINRNEESSKLGSGSYSTVWKGVCKQTRKVFAIKEMQKSSVKKDEEENLKEEVRISTLVGSHNNIVYMKEFVENRDRFYIVLEYLTGGELFDRIVDSPGGKFTEKDAARILRQVFGALAYLHCKGIVHRDLKPENFLLADETPDAPVKIADFGFACNFDGPNGLWGLCGSPGYVAPEIIQEKQGYGSPVDMWSMGVICYILLSGTPPFVGESDEESFALTLKGKYDKRRLEKVSSGAQDLCSKLLTYSPVRRLSAEGALQHPWITGMAPDRDLGVQDNLRSWRARMRFKKAIIATVATTRLHAIMRQVAARPDAMPDADC
mmetsp:Transcript_15673/g.38031  ORF Transcript_15673/g.38031 Transcript_15673/m.38031 type:complete len:379 (+) Transcript_15673:2-1138(+)